jgi:hypothetical protein
LCVFRSHGGTGWIVVTGMLLMQSAAAKPRPFAARPGEPIYIRVHCSVLGQSGEWPHDSRAGESLTPGLFPRVNAELVS